jgi:hypothetical protein
MQGLEVRKSEHNGSLGASSFRYWPRPKDLTPAAIYHDRIADSRDEENPVEGGNSF